MNEFKGTPGPWEKDGVEIRGTTQHQSEYICAMSVGYEPEDASLIAAAPELLAALQAVKVFMAEQTVVAEGLDVWVKVNKAIYKALGK